MGKKRGWRGGEQKKAVNFGIGGSSGMLDGIDFLLVDCDGTVVMVTLDDMVHYSCGIVIVVGGHFGFCLTLNSRWV